MCKPKSILRITIDKNNLKEKHIDILSLDDRKIEVPFLIEADPFRKTILIASQKEQTIREYSF